MTTRSDIEKSLRNAYAARVSGNVEVAMTYFADDGVFRIHGRGTGVPALSDAVVGKRAIAEAMAQLVKDWRFDDWKELALLVDGDKAALHWTARATCMETNKSEMLDAFDLVTFCDGKFVDFHQHVDTAMIMRLATP
jgi:ketosteroid isomerase-like protein